MKRKAQVAMESLMVYGIAILIVMLAIGALIYFGVLDLGSYLPDKCSLPGQVTCSQFRVSANQVQLELKNAVGKNIQVTAVKFTGTEDWNTYGCYQDIPVATPITINNGNIQLFTLNTALDASHTCTGFPVGKKVKGALQVTYKIVGSSIDVPLQGELQAKVG